MLCGEVIYEDNHIIWYSVHFVYAFETVASISLQFLITVEYYVHENGL